MMTPESAVTLTLILCMAGALLTLLSARRSTLTGWLALGGLVGASSLALYAAFQALRWGSGEPTVIFAVTGTFLELRLHVDGLSAVFLGLIAVVTLPVALYSIEYFRTASPQTVRRFYPNLFLFIASLYGLVTTSGMMYQFFFFWQGMTLSGFVLIRSERLGPETLHPARKYLWMMQLACLLTMVGAFLIAPASTVVIDGESFSRFDFEAVTHHLPELLTAQPSLVTAALLLFLVGFGIKVGMWPFGQVWLPDAHPAAPSPVSALLSGVMIKTGIYGLMRCFLWLIPAESAELYPAKSWGTLIILLATITLFHGTWKALGTQQSKRLLAFSTIGQAGYILFGLGASLILLSASDPGLKTLGAISFCGALLHTLNHAVFKSLLFLNAGAVLHRTHTQDLNRLGGLMTFMPLTALTALLASFSIAGVPLSSGFASKWYMYMATFQGSSTMVLLPGLAMVAVLTSTLTLALFIKFFGTIFLSRTSADVALAFSENKAREVGWPMQLGQSFLAVLCLLLGILPALGIAVTQAAVRMSPQGLGLHLAGALPETMPSAWGTMSPNPSVVYAPVTILVVLAVIFLLAHGLARLTQVQRRTSPPWLCGYALESEQNRYQAVHLYRDLHTSMPWSGTRTPAPIPTKAAPSPGRD